MRSFPQVAGVLLAGILLAATGCGPSAPQQPSPQAGPVFKPAARMVMTWVPPYSTDQSKARLAESYDGVGLKDALTHLALQWWEPTPTGELHRVQRGGDTSDDAVRQLRDWGHANGIRVLLCIYNFNTTTNAWDWGLAKSAFGSSRERLVNNLVAEMDRLGLDGIDLDLEGNGTLDADKDAYLEFVRELSAKLRARGKHLTVDSFAYVWHAPNQSWWAELFPLVDGINSMGYEEIGASAEEWRSFASQEAAAGANVAKLMLGMPAHMNRWRGNTTMEQLAWVRDKGHAGISLWDVQLGGSSWRTREAWTTIRQIRGGS